MESYERKADLTYISTNKNRTAGAVRGVWFSVSAMSGDLNGRIGIDVIVLAVPCIHDAEQEQLDGACHDP